MKKVIVCALVMAGFLIPFASMADDEVEKVRSRCEGNEQKRTAYDCNCITSAFKEAWSANKAISALQVYGYVMGTSATKCLQPEKIHASSLGHCGRSYPQYKNLDKGNLGKTKFCHCVADESIKLLDGMNYHNVVKLAKGNTKAFAICGEKTDYNAPAENTSEAQHHAPVATLPAGTKISATEDMTYLVILNKNFDLNRLDPVRFAMSADYKPHLNLKYVTPKNHAVTALPAALIKRGAQPPGIITSRTAEHVPTMAELYNQAILVKGSGLKELQQEIARVRAVTSTDYYVFIGEEIYLVPDIQSRL